jgi:AcrR family transcriptional regulator
MATRRRNRKAELTAAAVRLAANGGSAAATIRAIAREAGVTDAAIYRHYRSKDELWQSAYSSIVEEMVRDKRHLAGSDAPLREKLREWVRLSYAYFDRDPAAFAFAFVAPQVPPDSARRATREQRELFMQMIARARAAGEIRPIAPQVALCHFVGVMLSVPRLIGEGVLAGPASDYVDEVALAAWRILRPDDPGNPPDSRVGCGNSNLVSDRLESVGSQNGQAQVNPL